MVNVYALRTIHRSLTIIETGRRSHDSALRIRNLPDALSTGEIAVNKIT